MKDQVSQSFLQEKQCEWIPNGINTDIFKPSDSSIRTDLNLKNQKIILGIALSLSPWKGIDDLIALSRILSAVLIKLYNILYCCVLKTCDHLLA